jgi:hypothetical protein
MDDRGFKVDPNRDPLEPVRWWEQIGETQRPSPYNRASWICCQTHYKEVVSLPGGITTNQIFATVSVYDGKASNPDPTSIDSIYDKEGTILGSLSYEILGSVMTLTDWEHHNWRDASPVTFAFKALLHNTPPCVAQILVREPEAFWKSNGFVHLDKGSDSLIYHSQNSQPVPF